MNETNNSFTLFMVLLLIIVVGIIGTIAFFIYRRILRHAKDVERSLKIVPMLIKLPPSERNEANNRDSREMTKEYIARAEGVFNLLTGMGSTKIKSMTDLLLGKSAIKRRIFGWRYLSFEIIADADQIFFYVGAPISLVSMVEKALLANYPDIQIEAQEDHNIFSQVSKIDGVAGGAVVMTNDSHYPIKSYKHLDFDAMSGILASMSKLGADEGAAIQILVRPARKKWHRQAKSIAKSHLHPKEEKKGALSAVGELVKKPYSNPQSEQQAKPADKQPDAIDQQKSQAVTEKISGPVYECMIRVIASSASAQRSKIIVADMMSSFTQLNNPGYNGFKIYNYGSVQQLATDFIFRFFPVHWRYVVLGSAELATLFHLPSENMPNATPIDRTAHKEVAAPHTVPKEGLQLGNNLYRGVTSPVYLSDNDRRRHLYILGQTGTGKSNLLENLIMQDIEAGKGLAFIDPHGDTAEKILAKIPQHRSEDVVYFNPGDTEFPLGFNIMEYDIDHPEQKDFIIQEAISMLYKLYDPQHQGIIGPRYEHWFRNAALTVMADPEGGTFIEIPKVFTDNDYIKQKFKYVTDPTVQDFWTKEMAQTSDYHKSEMLGWFVSKFGAFASNEIMRNIIGQKKSAFNLREVMDDGKILLVNLSKGLLGDLNSQLLGIIFVIKFQMAAMSRANIDEEQRRDFSLYVDEFQNFSTDSIATILSEARKYRLSLILANQFIGQLDDKIREAIFGNVGSLMSFRTGPEDAEFMTKQFTPQFDQYDMVNIPNYTAVVKMIAKGVPTTPFTLKTLPATGTVDPVVAKAVRDLSRAKYGHPKAEIEKEIFESLKIATAAGAPPPPAPVVNR